MHFLAATLDLTSFFTVAFLRASHFFTAGSWAVFGFFFVIACWKAGILQSMDVVTCLLFLYTGGMPYMCISMHTFYLKYSSYYVLSMSMIVG